MGGWFSLCFIGWYVSDKGCFESILIIEILYFIKKKKVKYTYNVQWFQVLEVLGCHRGIQLISKVSNLQKSETEILELLSKFEIIAKILIVFFISIIAKTLVFCY